MENSEPLLPSMVLVGDLEENFYQLGLKDREIYPEMLRRTFCLGQTKTDFFNTLLKKIQQVFAGHILLRSPRFKKHTKAYAEGLGANHLEVVSGLLLPEFLTSLDKWLPGLPTALLGCSSLFALNEEGKPLHGRILDFPLVGCFDEYARILHFKGKGDPQIWSIGAAGLPYPSLTAMNDQGVTVALHQKYGRFFDPLGTPIFEMILELLRTCDDKKSVLKFLKTQRSLTTWGLFFSFTNGDVLAVDLEGKRFHKEEHILRPGDVLYFNNRPLVESEHNRNCAPYGMPNYCHMRSTVMGKRIKKLAQKSALTHLDILKALGRPTPQKSDEASHWKLGPTTATSLHIVSMDAASGSVALIPGKAPTILQKNYVSITELWEKPKRELKSSGLSPLDPLWSQAMSHWGQTISYLDQKDTHMAFHHGQMAVECFKGYEEEWVMSFFFCLLQFLEFKSKKDQQIVLRTLYELKNKLPPYLKDHCVLFIMRQERLLELTVSVKPSEIEHHELRALFEAEMKLSPLILKNLKALMIPRLEIMDVIYGHAKILLNGKLSLPFLGLGLRKVEKSL